MGHHGLIYTAIALPQSCFHLCRKLSPNNNPVGSRSLKSPHNRRIPHVRHFDVAAIIWMYSVPQIRTPTKPRILVYNPDGALRRIETLRPGHDRAVQFLDLAVVVPDA